MQGTTHLLFGTTASVLLIGVGGVGLGMGIHWSSIAIAWPRPLLLSLPSLPPADWPALVLAAGLGSILPDIDQPGSLITRLPARETRGLARLAVRVTGRHGAGSATSGLVAGGGGLVSALLGGAPRNGVVRRFLCFVVAVLCAALCVFARWLPPPLLLRLPEADRHILALAAAVCGAAALLLALGGVAGVIHRLPGHHRGLTHAPPFAMAIGAVAVIGGPVLVPALPGLGPAFAAGYLSHLASDALTVRGIPLWWPGTRQPSVHLLPRPLRVRTGGRRETLFLCLWLMLVPVAFVLIAVRYGPVA